MPSSIGLKALSPFSSILSSAVEAILAVARRGKKPADHSWQTPSPTDRRSPCPMINALANHGYLPHDGKDVSLARLVSALKEAINLAPDATLLVGVKALQTSTTGKRWTFHLDDLAKHGVIEHDGSLSRRDFSSGDNSAFAPEVWAAVASHFAGAETISIETAARARRERVFGSGTEGLARTEWVRILFEQERLPFEEGFTRSEKPLTISEMLVLRKKVEAAG
ncbi:hypothetical protein MFIFM68171_04705 [Madurella fahalii]|uniref:Heme haloperoxidase family profile domain-containing protein n=1 Tax=Madurella fahalii TaxID=1157608 RepID=A0ABQ0G9Q9_9PEZI